MRVLVTGSSGLVGRAVSASLLTQSMDVVSTNSNSLDLLDSNQVERFFSRNSFDVIVHCAARVGGIKGNSTFPATFISDNLMMQNNLFRSAAAHKIERLIFVASSCIYPPSAKLPLKEESLFTGKFEESNRWYATAKAAGIMHVEAINIQYGLNWISILPTNVYGPHDNFATETGHVVPSLMRKFAEAKKYNRKQVEIWGTGNPKRELIHVDDLASAIVHLINVPPKLPKPYMVNVGSGDEISIRDLAIAIREISQFQGELVFKDDYPDGVHQKTLDSSLILSTGWRPKIPIAVGLKQTYDWVYANLSTLRSHEIAD